jgi:hypothetical protein
LKFSGKINVKNLLGRVNSELKYNAAEISASIIRVGSGGLAYIESKTNLVRNT